MLAVSYLKELFKFGAIVVENNTDNINNGEQLEKREPITASARKLILVDARQKWTEIDPQGFSTCKYLQPSESIQQEEERENVKDRMTERQTDTWRNLEKKRRKQGLIGKKTVIQQTHTHTQMLVHTVIMVTFAVCQWLSVAG